MTSYDEPRARCAHVKSKGRSMAAVTSNTRRIALFARNIALCAALAGLGIAANAPAAAADAYDTAVQHAGRTNDDIKRDALDHPAEILRLAGIKPGMRVLDFLAADGYFSELLSYTVGPGGHVLLLNDPSFERWSGNAWQPRVANNRLPNVEHQVVGLDHMGLSDGSFDAILVV